MIKKIKDIVDKDLEFIRDTLREKFGPDDYKEKYKTVLRELAKIKHDEADPKHYQYYSDVYDILQKITSITRENIEWNDATCEIAFLLNQRHNIFDKEDAFEFAARESEEVYQYLIGLVEQDV